jgi:hypothetical protein
MKLLKNKKYLIGLLGALGIVGYVMYSKRNDPRNNGSANRFLGAFSLPVKNGEAEGEGQWIVIAKNRELATEKIRVGSITSYNGQTCTVKKIWKDKNGNVGGVRCEEIADGNYQVPNGSNLIF